SLFNIETRIKEIGIRKVLGANVTTITALLTKEFLRPVFISLFIAIPVAWWAMYKWLEDFAYRINKSWTVFAVAGFIAIFLAVTTVSFQTLKAAWTSPVKSLRSE